MSDIMRPVSFSELLERILGEYRNQNSVFGVPKEEFYYDKGDKSVKVFSQSCTTPLGPAAGPHTQLAQNIVTSYLVGARFMELKTVQIMDHLEIAKPCIDAADEGHNVEWSTEYTLEKAYDEYLKAWIILHIIESAMKNAVIEKPSFIFNMSVGYNLAGIKEEKMQTYINSMIDAGNKPLFDAYILEAKEMIRDGLFEMTDLEGSEDAVLASLDKISKNISPSVTVSTMHGCPPAEIEAICSYLLTEKKLDVFVKLNPTLLGYDTVRSILDSLGFGHIELSRAAFEHDLQLSDAKAMLKRLVALAASEGRGFGVKLTNTLGNVNPKDVLPGDERYMSGRTLLPISTRVALILSEEFGGRLPVSYSGGASALSAKDILESGIHPITLATDMLKPGGYMRMKQIAEILYQSKGWDMDYIDISKLKKLVEKASDPEGIVSKDFRGTNKAKVNTPLSLFDCYVAPCVEACPIHQPIPDYIALAGEGRTAEALALIYMTNALPNITGWICDHQCQNHCTRMDYEGAVQIREIKRICADVGFEEYKNEIWNGKEEPAEEKAAVIGAGPAGLSAAYFLASAGFDTHVFEKEKNAGGVVMNIIPEFRIPAEMVQKDIDFVEAQGAQFHFSAAKTVEELKSEGFDYIFVSIGADKSNDPGISGNGRRESAISFLYRTKHGEEPDLGKNVVVLGGGNTAMDAARMAKRVKGVEKVTVVYRRSYSEMPADREEYIMAKNDGVDFIFLANPSDITDGLMTVKEMELGEKDASGRRRPVETGRSFTIDCSYLISAIGEKADPAVLKALGADEEKDNVFIIGDTKTGPSTVVKCIASARAAVDAAIDSVYEKLLEGPDDDDCCCGHDHDDHECTCGHDHGDGHECTCGHDHGEDHECTCGHDHDDHDCGCGHDHDDEEESDEAMVEAENRFFAAIKAKKARITLPAEIGAPDFLKIEASRCVECSYMCNKCVEVCPNRANVALDMRECGIFEDPFQILHLDAYCNECGNCATFCPHSGGPYLKKFTLFSRMDDFENSENSGFYAYEDKLIIRLDGKIILGEINGDGFVEADVPDEVKAMITEVFISYPYLLGPVEE